MIRRQKLLVLTLVGLLAGGCGSDSGQSAMRQGLAAFNEKNYPAAIAHLTRATKRLTDSAPLYYHLGLAHLYHLTRATKRLTDSAPLYYHLGLAHLYQGDMEPALAAFNAVLELVPDHSEATACLGQIAYLQNDQPKAQAYFEKALATASGDEAKARLLTSLALTEMARNRNDLARLYLLRAQWHNRLYAPALYNLASLYRDKFNLREEALDQFELYVRLAPKGDRHREKAENNIKRLRLNLARTQAEEAEGLRRDPAAAARLLQEGARLHAAKQYPKASKAFRDALAADPLTFSAAYGLAVRLTGSP